jgi:Holliday junction resolvasome RuvABC endonuclease subunit
LTAVPSPHDAADALAVAICHVNSHPRVRLADAMPVARPPKSATSWRHFRP